jgi:hypothetical protein
VVVWMDALTRRRRCRRCRQCRRTHTRSARRTGDREIGWVEGTGFATLCFGVADDETGEVRNIPHQDGWVIHMPHPMNQNYLHGVPKRKRVTDCRISLTFREIVANL